MTLSVNEMPDRNTKILYSYGNTNSTIDHSLTGPNYNWDYSALEYVFQESMEYKSAGSINAFFFTLGLNAFGTKTLDSLGFGQIQVKDVYDVYKTTSKKMTAEGRSIRYNGIPIPQFYSDKDEVYRYPFTYRDTSRDSYAVSFSLGATLGISQTGRRENIAEGWGTLKTPYKTYNNVLKIKTTVQGTDTVRLAGFPIPIPRNTMEYKWFTPGVRGPVLIVTGNVLLGRFTPSEIRFVDEEVSLLGFSADQVLVDTTQIVTIEDTSGVQTFLREWKITPEHVVFESGTDFRDNPIKVRFLKAGKYNVELSVTNRFGQLKEQKNDYIEVKVVDVVPAGLKRYFGALRLYFS